MKSHTILGEKVRLYRRPRSNIWQCATSLKGREYRISTKEDSLEHAKQVAEDWYLELRGKDRAGILHEKEMLFEEAAKIFLKEYPIVAKAYNRSPKWIKSYEERLRLHILPFLGKRPVSQIDDGTATEYDLHRIDTSPPGKSPARNTIHNEIVTIRQVLKTAKRHKKLAYVPDLTRPYQKRTKIVRRAWFSPEDYKKLYTATRENIKTCYDRDRWSALQLHDFVLFMANTGLRPDEAKNLEHRDIAIVYDKATEKNILEIDVRGKVGVRPCKSMPMAVEPYQRLKNRIKPLSKEEAQKVREGGPKIRDADRKPKATDKVFPGHYSKMFNGILRRSGLKFDRDGVPRTAYSLRHSYCCFRLLDGAKEGDVAANMGTSTDMINENYGRHIAGRIDTTTLNVRKPKVKERNA